MEDLQLGYLLPWIYIRQHTRVWPMAKPSPTYAGDPSLVSLGQAIRHFRSKEALSQEELALHAGLDRSYLGGIERGEHNVAVVNLFRIASALDVSLAQLFKEADL
jgi:ribosome-binding protein aMBF1 (putative translation factor)